MKLFFFFIAISVCKIGVSQGDDLTRNYFVQKQLITSSQLSLLDSFKVQVKKSYRESVEQILKQAKTSEEKETYEKQLKMIDSVDGLSMLLPAYDNKDTLRKLMSYLVVSCRGSISSSAFNFSVSYADSLDPQFRRPSRDSLILFLKSIQLAGLISPVAGERTQQLITDNQVVDSFSVVMKAIENKELEDYFSVVRVKDFLDKLTRIGIMKQTGADKILSLAKQNKLTHNYQILSECEKAAIIDLNELPDYPEGYMLPLYKKMASVLPELSFSDFSVKVEKYKEAYDTSSGYRTIVSLVNNGRKYLHSDFYSPADYDKDGHPDNEWKTGDNIETILNRILKDKQSPYRVHTTSHFAGYKERRAGKIGFIALTKEQEEALHSGSYLDVGYQNYDKAITSDEINEAIKLYRKIGLLNHLSQKEIDSCIQSIKEKEINYYSDILSSFKNLVFEIDLEYGVNDGQYKLITKQIAGISKGHFKPEKIIDTYNWDKRKSFEYGFSLNGKKYITQLTQEDDWLDPGFWELIEKAVKEQDKKGRFHLIYPNDGMRYISLTNEQYRMLKEKKLLEFESTD